MSANIGSSACSQQDFDMGTHKVSVEARDIATYGEVFEIYIRVNGVIRNIPILFEYLQLSTKVKSLGVG
jgi:hypothetical protein